MKEEYLKEFKIHLMVVRLEVAEIIKEVALTKREENNAPLLVL